MIESIAQIIVAQSLAGDSPRGMKLTLIELLTIAPVFVIAACAAPIDEEPVTEDAEALTSAKAVLTTAALPGAEIRFFTKTTSRSATTYLELARPGSPTLKVGCIGVVKVDGATRTIDANCGDYDGRTGEESSFSIVHVKSGGVVTARVVEGRCETEGAPVSGSPCEVWGSALGGIVGQTLAGDAMSAPAFAAWNRAADALEGILGESVTNRWPGQPTTPFVVEEVEARLFDGPGGISDVVFAGPNRMTERNEMIRADVSLWKTKNKPLSGLARTTTCVQRLESAMANDPNL
jgi:hypothetical protein